MYWSVTHCWENCYRLLNFFSNKYYKGLQFEILLLLHSCYSVEVEPVRLYYFGSVIQQRFVFTYYTVCSGFYKPPLKCTSVCTVSGYITVASCWPATTWSCDQKTLPKVSVGQFLNSLSTCAVEGGKHWRRITQLSLKGSTARRFITQPAVFLYSFTSIKFWQTVISMIQNNGWKNHGQERHRLANISPKCDIISIMHNHANMIKLTLKDSFKCVLKKCLAVLLSQNFTSNSWQ